MLTKKKYLLVYVYCSTLFCEDVNTIIMVKKRSKKVKVKVNPRKATKAQRGSRSIILLFF